VVYGERFNPWNYRETLKSLVCRAINEAQRSENFPVVFARAGRLLMFGEVDVV
jgi:hypothetical protein